VLDFTSALYLGIQHPSWSLAPWSQFTTGVPAALAPPAKSCEVAEALARLQGCESALLGPSTLHLFWDLFGSLGRDGVSIYLDEGAYPIAQWGIERAACRGAFVQKFPHYDPEALAGLLLKNSRRGGHPLVVADGFCPDCGKPAPVKEYLRIAERFGGRLILDDTQALGIFGSSPGPTATYGKGGGGMLQWSGVAGADVVMISSLAKGFGVPIAVLSSGCSTVRQFQDKSETQVHCSPPSIAVIDATEHALSVNQERGDALRLRLAQLVRRFRKRVAGAGFVTVRGVFPVQTLAPISGLNPTVLHEELLRVGIRTVLRGGQRERGTRISFLISALHSLRDIDHTAETLALAVQRLRIQN
jgi:8-amino-7-oxononanoate synthase